MHKILHIALVVLAALSTACRASPDATEMAAREMAGQAGGLVMEFELTALEGGTVSPTEAGGDLILIDFWATWCAPCHLQADILAKLYPEFRSRGVEFFAVSLGEPEAVVREFVAKRPFAYPVLVDPADMVASSYGLYILPTVVLLDHKGTVLYFHEGISTAARLRSVVDEIIGRQSAGRRSAL